jgi:putative flavoprotein involved in K+ transport
MAAGYYLKQHGDDFIIMDTCKPYTEDRHPLLAKGVIWATGFRPDYHWVNLPVFDETGIPRHIRRVVPEAPGLYFLDLHFQTALTSSLLGGVGEDAKNITDKILTTN